MEPYRVFISSIMNRSVEDLAAERAAVHAAVDQFAPVTAAWAFEAEPASAQPLLDCYLDAVKTSDLFVLILGEHITKPVHDEYDTACDHGKPILVFPKAVTNRSAEADRLLAGLNAKYDGFVNAAELREKARKSLGLHLLRHIRGGDESALLPGDRVGRLRRLAEGGRSVSIMPIVPRAPNNEYRIRKIDRDTIVLHKSNGQDILIPSHRVEDLVEIDGTPTILLNGRLQWVTIPGEWRFLPEKPPSPDPLGIGLGRVVSRDVADFPNFPNPGYRFSWTNPQNVPNSEVFFDGSGVHLTNGGQILTCGRYR